LPHNARARFWSFTATNSGRNPNWPSVCRQDWVGAFETLNKGKKNKLDQKGFYQKDGHDPSGGHDFGMMTMAAI